MVIEIKKSKSVFIILGIIGLLSAIASILIVAFVEDRQSVPYILMTPAIVFLVVLIYFIVFLISYIKKPYLYLIKFEDDYIELTKDREVFYKDISYVLTDDNDYIKYFVITSHNKIGFYHKSKEVNKFLIDLLKSKDVKVIGMDEGWYNGLMIATASVATLGTFTSSFCSSFNIKSITQIGKVDKYYGIKFTQPSASGNVRVKTLGLHSPHNGHPWHWQLNSINPRTGTIGKGIRWDLLLRRIMGG